MAPFGHLPCAPQYNNNQSFPEIGACRSDLLVLLRFSPKSATDEGYVQYHAPQVVRTVDGKHVFSPFRDIGTVGTNPELIREKVQFAPDITAVGESTFAETQYLITGNVRFTTQGGEPLLAYSSFYEVRACTYVVPTPVQACTCVVPSCL